MKSLVLLLVWSRFSSSSGLVAPSNRYFPRHPPTLHDVTTAARTSSSRRRSRIRPRTNIFTSEGNGIDLLPNSNATIATASISFDSTTTTTNDSSFPPTPTFKECLAFALPALGIYICSPLMSLIDASFIGRISSSMELAALGPASSISDCAPLPLLFLSIGATNLMAKTYSKENENPQACAPIARTAMSMGGICGLVLATLLYFTSKPLSALYCGTSASLAPYCQQYVAIRALALPAVVVTTIAQAILIGTKDTKTPMMSVAIAALGNLIGDLWLVQGLKMGIAGAAWATSASQILSAGLLVRALKRRGFLNKPQQRTAMDNQAQHQNQEQHPSKWSRIQKLLSFVPFLFVMTVKIGWHNSCTATAASLGGISAAAHTALISVAMVCMVLGDVGSSLSQAFLPVFETTKNKLSTDPSSPRDDSSLKEAPEQQTTQTSFDMEAAMPTVKQLMKCTLSISATVTVLAGIVIGGLGGQITSDQAVLREMRRTLPWLMTALTFHGSAVTLEGLLLSRKMFPTLTVCYSVLAVCVAAYQVAIRKFGLGLAGVWGCYVWFCASRVVAFSTLGGLWRPRKVWEKLRLRKTG